MQSARHPENAVARLNLPPITPRITRGADGVTRIFDPLRRRPVALTPEEWVRQHFAAYLTGPLAYPRELTANEVSLRLNGTLRRCDTVVFSREGLRPLVIVEYKAPSIPVTQRVFDQIARYNLVHRAPCLMVSNGLTHYCCLLNPSPAPPPDAAPNPDSAASATTRPPYRFLPTLPTYPQLLSLLHHTR